jgi:hypothetical protein
MNRRNIFTTLMMCAKRLNARLALTTDNTVYMQIPEVHSSILRREAAKSLLDSLHACMTKALMPEQGWKLSLVETVV